MRESVGVGGWMRIESFQVIFREYFALLCKMFALAQLGFG